MDQLLGPIQEQMALVEERLDRALQSDVELVHQVARYMAGLKGKRFRPALALLGAQASGAWNERVIDAAAAVEMIHTATIMHDDVVDSAATRRGKATVNSAWDDHVAVLMGDFLLSRALNILVDLGHPAALEAVSRATERLSQGELFEIQIGLQNDTREDSYLGMVSDKTASLVAAACQIGPLLVGAPPSVVTAMGAYGESLGLAFQIADDILDFTGDASTLGKPVGHDLRAGRITLPLIYALAAASPEERSRVEGLRQREGKGEDEWRQILEFVARRGGVAAALRTARQHAARAEGSLSALPPTPARTALAQAARLVVDRSS